MEDKQSPAVPRSAKEGQLYVKENLPVAILENHVLFVATFLEVQSILSGLSQLTQYPYR